MFSIVIPAHNEAAVIERCLQALLEGLEGHDYEVIVVCNGCRDNTAALAAQFAGVTVLEESTPSKVLALNAGDQRARGFPRAYVDADVVVKGTDLLQAMQALEHPGTDIVAPELEVDVSKSSAFVRAFYRIWMQLPYFTDQRMVGSGIYILSQAGRRRFTHFPELIADDGYVRALFKPEERLTVRGCCFRIFAPRTLADLIKIKTRVRFGNLELNKKYPGLSMGGENNPGAFIHLLVKHPQWIVHGLIYAYVQFKTQRNSRKRFAQADFSTWERDESSRAP